MHVIAALACFGFVAVLSAAWPKGFKHLFAAPLFGTCLGGFAWSLVGLFGCDVVSCRGFASFVAAGVILAELLALLVD